MNHFPKIFLTAAIAVAVCSCSEKNGANIPVIDLATNVGCSNVGSLNDLFEVTEIVNPELTDSTLLKYADVRGERDNILYVQEGNRLLTFDATTGKCVTSFDKSGQGPEDYVVLYFAFPSKTNGNWVSNDIRTGKIVSYTPDGRFVTSKDLGVSSGICPNGEGWATLKNALDGEKLVIYLLDNDFNITDSVATNQTSYYTQAELLTPFNGYASFKNNPGDTIFTLDSNNRFVPSVAISLGKYKHPIYSLDESEKMWEDRHKYIYHDFIGLDNLGIIAYQFDEKVCLQIYSLADNKLLYSFTTEKADFKGLPFMVNGEEKFLMPTSDSSGDALYFCTMPDDDDADSNPTILKLVAKKQS